MRLLLLLCLLASCVAFTSGDAFNVSVNWLAASRVLRTVPTYQVVVNPLTTRASPIHDAVYKAIRALNASMVRFVPWLPYPRLAVAELEPPSGDRLCGFCNQEGRAFPLDLSCGRFGTIAEVEFASFGTPTGFCRSLSLGKCHHNRSEAVVRQLCLGRNSCRLVPDVAFFGGSDPCPGTDKRLAVQVKCSLGGRFTSWDFSQLDPMMEDFMNAQGNRSVIINFSTPPNWLYKADRSLYPDDPLGETWNYEQGTQLVDPTGRQFGDYYGRLLAWYTDGGFTDEFGIYHKSGHHYNIPVWENLNEPEGEHHNTPESYAIIYDAMVSGMRRHAPRGSANMEWMGMALMNHREWEWYEYFLNASNHAPGIPLQWVSFHFYAEAESRTDPAAYANFFPSADSFVEEVQQIIKLRDKLAPGVKLDVDECGVILPDDNSPTASEFPLTYWNAAAAMYGYLYGKLSVLGLDVLGESQLVGYPQITLDDGTVFPPQFPSVSMLNWTTGAETARYWALKILIDHMKPGSDKLATTEVNPIISNLFCGTVLQNNNVTLTCPGSVIGKIILASYGTPIGTCPNFREGTCNTPKAKDLVEASCLNKESCSVFLGDRTLGDPCPGSVKRGVIVAQCRDGGGYSPSSPGVYAQGYLSSDGTRKVLVVNKADDSQHVTMRGATGARWTVVDEPLTAPSTSVLKKDTWTLKPWSVGILVV